MMLLIALLKVAILIALLVVLKYYRLVLLIELSMTAVSMIVVLKVVSMRVLLEKVTIIIVLVLVVAATVLSATVRTKVQFEVEQPPPPLVLMASRMTNNNRPGPGRIPPLSVPSNTCRSANETGIAIAPMMVNRAKEPLLPSLLFTQPPGCANIAKRTPLFIHRSAVPHHFHSIGCTEQGDRNNKTATTAITSMIVVL